MINFNLISHQGWTITNLWLKFLSYGSVSTSLVYHIMIWIHTLLNTTTKHSSGSRVAGGGVCSKNVEYTAKLTVRGGQINFVSPYLTYPAPGSAVNLEAQHSPVADLRGTRDNPLPAQTFFIFTQQLGKFVQILLVSLWGRRLL